MNEKAGKVYSIAKENVPVPGCTISKAVSSENGYYIYHFSLAAGTDISAEIYRYHKLWITAQGDLLPVVKGEPSGTGTVLHAGDIYVTPIGTPVGAATADGTVYTEISLRKDTEMNSILKAGEVFALKDLLPYQEGKIINMDLINDEHLKLVIMSYDAGTGVPEHAAPGEAMVFALDGEAIISYEGKEHRIKAGENLKFDKGGVHSVTADHRFKMAVLITL